MTLIDSLKWRYATKRFDATRQVGTEDLQTLKEATNLAASSFGLQPYRVLVIEDPKVKEQLREASYNQPQLTESSHVFVFAAKRDLTPEYIDSYVDRIAEVRGVARENLDGYAEYMKGSVAGKDLDSVRSWNQRQAYIGLGTLLAAAAELGIDTCPMEGFDVAAYDRILGLEEQGLTATVIAPVGYRSPEDATQEQEKVRFSLDEMFTTI
ncbi:nitroreductase [Lewinella marina]|uniref:NAD(P)H-dependent oxidoreductase n=1 Tax=Neolewinella marina TaxID=438751 RepID=A0A2G0CKA1_9BACT|nr:NAD(P)H-dependent oxidoreductase [Neolewinella marina]NJB84412.1 nitroreductase [Neolewinella marina]PHL00395.1 NAD(P)H-dependent oxidoreductase [Neolewinella marina]